MPLTLAIIHPFAQSYSASYSQGSYQSCTGASPENSIVTTTRSSQREGFDIIL